MTNKHFKMLSVIRGSDSKLQERYVYPQDQIDTHWYGGIVSSTGGYVTWCIPGSLLYS